MKGAHRQTRKQELAASSAGLWFVYMLRCSDRSLYTGITKDVQRRSRQHNDGTASRYTRSRRPTRLVYLEDHPSLSAALRREAAIKALTRRQKEALIRLAQKSQISSIKTQTSSKSQTKAETDRSFPLRCSIGFSV